MFGCASESVPTSYEVKPVGEVDSSGIVVQSRVVYSIESGEVRTAPKAKFLYLEQSQATKIISVTNAPSMQFTLDDSLFKVPELDAKMLSFGKFQITKLQDNNLRICGKKQNEKCSKAVIRAYTTGESGSGLYNQIGGYGAPIYMGQSTIDQTVGLEVNNAVILQSINLASNKNVVHLSDFSNPAYGVNIDFSNAGAGSYKTALVIEYALIP